MVGDDSARSLPPRNDVSVSDGAKSFGEHEGDFDVLGFRRSQYGTSHHHLKAPRGKLIDQGLIFSGE